MKAMIAGVLLAGCDLVYGLDRPMAPADSAPEDVPSPDEPMVDAMPCVAGAPSLLSTPPTPVIADTMLLDESNANPANRYGASPIINIGQGGSSRVLARFGLSPLMLELLAVDDSRLRSATLTIHLRPNDCPGGCINGQTNFQVYAATNAWNEGGASYTGAAWVPRRQSGTSDPGRENWQASGANGFMDRDPAALGEALVPTPMGGALSFDLALGPGAIAAMRTRLSGSELSLIAVPTFGGTLFLVAVEDQPAATTLTFSYCP